MKFTVATLLALFAFNSFALTPKEVLECGKLDSKKVLEAKSAQEVFKFKLASPTGQYATYLDAKENDEELAKALEKKFKNIKSCAELEKNLNKEWKEMASEDYSNSEDLASMLAGFVFMKPSDFTSELKTDCQEKLEEEGFNKAARELTIAHKAIILTLILGDLSSFGDKPSDGVYATMDDSQHAQLSKLWEKSKKGEISEKDYMFERDAILRKMSAYELEPLVVKGMAKKTLEEWIIRGINQ